MLINIVLTTLVTGVAEVLQLRLHIGRSILLFILFYSFSLKAEINTDTLTYTDFQSVEKDFQEVFATKVQRLHNLKLVILKDDDSPKYLGGAQILNGEFIISYGADLPFDQVPKITPNGFALLLCHELGHLFGGHPKKIYNGQVSWAASEGQADYFAASNCLKMLYQYKIKPPLKEEVQRGLPNLIVDTIKRNAEAYFQGIAAIYDLYPGMQKFSRRPSLQEKDPTVVEETNLNYPSFQCRLDTYRAGADNAPRPQCWFKR